MIRISDHAKPQPGFTLLELLVVMTLISLQATVVISAVGNVRERAQNNATNQLIEQYAFALFENKLLRNEPYPYAPSDTYYCIGDYPDDRCGFDNSAIESTEFNEYLESSLQIPVSEFPQITPVEYVGQTFEGPIYRCRPSGAAGGCDDFYLYYFLLGENQTCAGGFAGVTTGGHTYCAYGANNPAI